MTTKVYLTTPDGDTVEMPNATSVELHVSNIDWYVRCFNAALDGVTLIDADGADVDACFHGYHDGLEFSRTGTLSRCSEKGD